MSKVEQPAIKESSKQSVSRGILSLIKFARPVIILAAVFYLFAAATVLASPEQIAQEALGPDYNDRELQAIQIIGGIMLAASAVFFYSARLMKPTATLRQLRLSSILVVLSAVVTIGSSRNVFSLLLLLILAGPALIIWLKVQKLLLAERSK